MEIPEEAVRLEKEIKALEKKIEDMRKRKVSEVEIAPLIAEMDYKKARLRQLLVKA
jgi:hypothetical protein